MPPKLRKQNPEARHKLTADDWEKLQSRNLTGDDRAKAIRDYKKNYRKSKEKVEKVTRRQWTKIGKKPAKEQSRLDEINKYTIGDSKRHIKKFSTDVEKLKVPFTTFLQRAEPDGSSLNYWLPEKAKGVVEKMGERFRPSRCDDEV